jgi:NADH-quinone oxidoreductase subunit G
MTQICQIEIDGRACDATPGESLLTTLHRHGIVVPALCHHPGLSCPATCRSCVVHVEDAQADRHVVTACNHSVSAGMVLHVEDEDSRQLRSRALAQLLQRHAMDCPTCEAAGECEFQEAVAGHGPQRQPHELQGATDRVQLGTRLIFDAGRCIQCGRCARFEHEVSGTQQLSMQGRGGDIDIVAATTGVDHAMAGNLVDLCPAGALVDPESTFLPPTWTRRSVDTVCGGCGTGCAIRADIDGEGRVVSLRPRHDEQVNGWWMCDHGRYESDADHEDRLALPEPPSPDPETAWQVSIDRLKRRLMQPRSAVWLSPFLTLEEAFLLIEAAQGWRARLFQWAPPEAQEQSFPGGFKISACAAPNATGLQRLLAGSNIQAGSTTDLQMAIAEKQVGQLLMCGGGPAGGRPPLKRDGVVFVAAHDLTGATAADLLIPASHWLEKDGTFLNQTQQLRRVRPARRSASGHTDLELMLALTDRGDTSAGQVFAELAERFTWLEGNSYAQLDADARTQPSGVAAGGAWMDSLQRQRLLVIEDPVR